MTVLQERRPLVAVRSCIRWLLFCYWIKVVRFYCRKFTADWTNDVLFLYLISCLISLDWMEQTFIVENFLPWLRDPFKFLVIILGPASRIPARMASSCQGQEKESVKEMELGVILLPHARRRVRDILDSRTSDHHLIPQVISSISASFCLYCYSNVWCTQLRSSFSTWCSCWSKGLSFRLSRRIWMFPRLRIQRIFQSKMPLL
jgi:hypothetical protein